MHWYIATPSSYGVCGTSVLVHVLRVQVRWTLVVESMHASIHTAYSYTMVSGTSQGTEVRSIVPVAKLEKLNSSSSENSMGSYLQACVFDISNLQSAENSNSEPLSHGLVSCIMNQVVPGMLQMR